MKYFRLALLALSLVVLQAGPVFGHCQIPCGIYDDDLRFSLISEDIDTVEKSMREIIELSSAEEKDYNSIVRWVDNKEIHADRISETVTYYFMAQRVKPADKEDHEGYAKYVTELKLLHELMLCSMKAKQTTDLANVDKMRSILAEFRKEYYSGKKD
jgi:nickel superoxide dismutase